MPKLHHPYAGLLVVRSQHQTMIPLTKEITTLGRKHSDILLNDVKVSSLHAEIRRQGNQFVLVDLNSTNGTILNRQQIKEAVLSDQDVIEIGITTLCFFEDLREFHGPADEISKKSGKSKVEADSADQNLDEAVTTTQTLPQIILEAEILEGEQEGKVFRFKKSHVLLGRNDADLILIDADVSRNHAMFEVLGKNSVYLRDLASTNGTFVNGKRITSQKIMSGDEITVGTTILRVQFDLPLVEDV